MSDMQYRNDWLKKQLDIEDITISLSAQHTSAESLKDDAPLLRTRAVRLAVLAPVFAVLADRTVVGQTTAVTDLLLEPVVAAVSSQQVSWLKTFAQMMPTVLAARGKSLLLLHLTAVHASAAVLMPFMTSTINVYWSSTSADSGHGDVQQPMPMSQPCINIANLHALDTSATCEGTRSRDCEVVVTMQATSKKQPCSSNQAAAFRRQGGGASWGPQSVLWGRPGCTLLMKRQLLLLRAQMVWIRQHSITSPCPNRTFNSISSVKVCACPDAHAWHSCHCAQ